MDESSDRQALDVVIGANYIWVDITGVSLSWDPRLSFPLCESPHSPGDDTSIATSFAGKLSRQKDFRR